METKRQCVREEKNCAGEGQNDLTMNAWSVVLRYLPNRFQSHPQWKLCTLSYTSQQAVLQLFEHRNALCVRIHQRFRELLTKLKNYRSIMCHVETKRFHHTLHCVDDECKVSHCSELKRVIDESPQNLLSYQYVREHLTEDITPYPYRFVCLEEDKYKWRIIAWHIVRFGVSKIYNTAIVRSLEICFAKSLVNSRDGLVAVHYLMTWYIRMTNEIKNIYLVSRVLNHVHAAWFYQPLFCSSILMLENWVSENLLRRPFHSIGDPIEEDMSTDDISMTGDDEEEEMDDAFLFYEDDSFICRMQDGYDFFIDKQTNVAYNHLFEEVGVYNERLWQIFFYRHFYIQTYFPTASFLRSPLNLANVISLMSRKDRPRPRHMIMSQRKFVTEHMHRHGLNRMNVDFLREFLHMPLAASVMPPDPDHGDFQSYF